jgi:IclR family acetate operon transcriptional repressor
VESVDNALRLLHLLRDNGRLRVSEAATELGIARSTAHRLLAMLVYRDFAMRDEQRGYLPGPALLAAPVLGGPARHLRRALLPHLEALCARVDETVNLTVRVGTQTRFIASVESEQVLHVGDRQGTVLPARRTSGGKALLALLPAAELADLYADEPDLDSLRRELDTVRARGYALNREATETGVSAIGRALTDGSGRAVAAISIAVPTARFTQDRIGRLAAELAAAVEHARAELATP